MVKYVSVFCGKIAGGINGRFQGKKQIKLPGSAVLPGTPPVGVFPPYQSPLPFMSVTTSPPPFQINTPPQIPLYQSTMYLLQFPHHPSLHDLFSDP